MKEQKIMSLAPLHFGKKRVEQFVTRLFPQRRLERILLVNPPDAPLELFRQDIAQRKGLSNFPPYGLGVLSSHLLRIGIDVRILNLNHEILKACANTPGGNTFDRQATLGSRLDEMMEEFDPDLVGVTCMFTMTHPSLKEACKMIAAYDKPIAIGGVHVSNDVDEIMADIAVADMAFLREADISFPNFVEFVRGRMGVGSLGQMVFRENGELHTISKECRPSAQEMDVIPELDLMKTSELSRFGYIGSFGCFLPPQSSTATALSNRGCRAQCSFCSVRSFNGVRVRQRSVESVLDELEMLENDHGIAHIMWLDDDLFKDERRALSLFEGMVKRKLRMTWDASNGVIASSCTEELISASAASGCVGIIIGMESGNPEILRRTRKPGTVESFIKAAEVLRKHPTIFSNVYLMFGFPGETMGMIRDTIKVSLEMNLDWYRIKPLQPLPNTPIYAEMVALGLIDPTDSVEVRYMTGAYGKHQMIDASAGAYGIVEAVASIPDDAIPLSDQIDDIWLFMNFDLNYRKALSEEAPIKLHQLEKYSHHICNFLSPDNCFALYTLAMVQKKLGYGDPKIKSRLERILAQSSLWRSRFKSFGLKVSDLEAPVEVPSGTAA